MGPQRRAVVTMTRPPKRSTTGTLLPPPHPTVLAVDLVSVISRGVRIGVPLLACVGVPGRFALPVGAPSQRAPTHPAPHELFLPPASHHHLSRLIHQLPRPSHLPYSSNRRTTHVVRGRLCVMSCLLSHGVRTRAA